MKTLVLLFASLTMAALPNLGFADDDLSKLQTEELTNPRLKTKVEIPKNLDLDLEQNLKTFQGGSSGRMKGRAAFQGGADAGGGDTVGDELFDDYENKGSVPLKAERIQKLIKPYLKNIEAKVPGFGPYLLEGVKGIHWYLEPKALRQDGPCQNSSKLAVQKVVRACQSMLDARIDKDFFEEHPDIQGPLLLHELLVYHKIRNNQQELIAESTITEEGVREASRQLRDFSISAEDLQATLSSTAFGAFMTMAQRDRVKSLSAQYGQEFCKIQRKEKGHRNLKEIVAEVSDISTSLLALNGETMENPFQLFKLGTFAKCF